MTWHSPHRSLRFTLLSRRQDLSRGAWVNPIRPPSWVNPIPSPGSGRPRQDLAEAAGNTAGGRFQAGSRQTTEDWRLRWVPDLALDQLNNHFWAGCYTTWLRKQHLWAAVRFLPNLMSLVLEYSMPRVIMTCKCLILSSPHSLLQWLFGQHMPCLLSTDGTEFRDTWSAGIGKSSIKTIQAGQTLHLPKASIVGLCWRQDTTCISPHQGISVSSLYIHAVSEKNCKTLERLTCSESDKHVKNIDDIRDIIQEQP